MTVVIAQIDIDAPPEQVWDYVTDLRATPHWVTIVRDISHIDDGPLVPGFRVDQVLCLRGVKFKVHWTLEEARAPYFARWEGRGPARSRAVIEDRLSARNGGTHFDYRNEFKSPLGAIGAVTSRALVGGIPEREAHASLQRLKAILENR